MAPFRPNQGFFPFRLIDRIDHHDRCTLFASDKQSQQRGCFFDWIKIIIMPRDLQKTLTYLAIHLVVGFSVAYAFTGSLGVASGIALIEPCINAVAFFFHEKLWSRADRGAMVARFRRDALAHG